MERFLDQTADHPDILVGPMIHGRHADFAYESIRSFVKCLALGKPVAASLDDGMLVSKVILAKLESASKRAHDK